MSVTTENARGKLNVRIERLPGMRAARFHAFGRNPEMQAWSKLRQWAQDLLKDPVSHPVFGFNNPSPISPLAEYGYEFWIRIEPDMIVPSDVDTIEFPGGCYAVLTHHVLPNPDIWMQLVEWVRLSPHSLRQAHELEHPHNPLASETEMVFDLYLPVEAADATASGAVKVRGTDFVMYPVSNLAEAARFYRETLGLPQEMYSEQWQWAEFNCGNVTLALKGGEKLPETIVGGRIALAVEDVPAAYAELKRLGVRMLSEPVDYGVCSAVEVSDPDGNTIILHKRADQTWGMGTATRVGTSERGSSYE